MLRFTELKSLTLQCGVTLHQGDRLLGCEGSTNYIVLIQQVDDAMTGDTKTICYVRDLTHNILRTIDSHLVNEEIQAEDYAIP